MDTSIEQKKEPIRAWHFIRMEGKDLILRDGKKAPKKGEWLVHEGDIKICESGLHASRRAFDALSYAPDGVLAVCLVECEDIIEEHADKFVCRKRKIVSWKPATELLRYFARQCALRHVDKWNPTAEDLAFLNLPLVREECPE